MENTPCIRIGHLKIVDHLILGITDLLLNSREINRPHFHLEASAMTSWQQVTDSLTENEIDGAFLPAPMAMDLFAQGLDIKILMFAHRAGSVIVKSSDPALESLSDFNDKTILVPSELSIQTMLLHRLLASAGLKLARFDDPSAEVSFEAVPPFLMTEMAGGDPDNDIAGFAVPEPFAGLGIQTGAVQKLCTTASLWKDHPCCVFVLNRDMVKHHPRAVSSIMECFMQTAYQLNEPDNETVMDMAGVFLDMDTQSVRRMIRDCGVCFDPELLIPDPAPLEMIQHYMADTMKLIDKKIRPANLIDDSFISNLMAET